MPLPPSCLSTQQHHTTLLALQKDYSVALTTAKETSNWLPVKRLKAKIESQKDLFKKELYPLELVTLTIGGMNVEKLEEAMDQANMQIDAYTKQHVLESKDSSTSKTKERIDLVRLTVEDLGFLKNATYEQIVQRAKELGLELCPAEVGPHYRLQYTDQPMNEWVYVGMRPISGADGGSRVFRVERDDDGMWLSYGWADPTDVWFPSDQFLFRLRKSED